MPAAESPAADASALTGRGDRFGISMLTEALVLHFVLLLHALPPRCVAAAGQQTLTTLNTTQA